MEKTFANVTKWSIYLLVFLIPLFWLPFSFEVFEFNKQYLMFFLTILALFFWLARTVLVDKEIRFKKSPLDIPILVFLFLAILGTIFSVDKFSSIFGFYGRFSDGLIGLLSMGIFYFLVTNNVVVQKEKVQVRDCEIPLDRIIKIFLWSVFFVALSAYLSVFGVWSRIDGLLGGKLSLPQVLLQRTFNPATGSMEGLAVFLAVILVFLVGRIISKGKGRKNIDILFSLAILFLLVLIDFNPAWLIIALSLILFLIIILWKRIFKEDVNKLLLPIILVILAGVFFIVNTSQIQFYLLKTQLPQEQVLSQTESWAVGFKGATDNIKTGFLGSGVGTFNYDFAKFKSESFNDNLLWQIRFDRPGNNMAEILGTMGFLGLLSWFILIGFFLMISYLFLQKNQSGVPLLMAFLACFAAQFFFYQNTILAFSFWLILSLSVVNWQKPLNEKVKSFKDFPELSLVISSVLIVLGIIFVVFLFYAGKFYWADMNYASAYGVERTKVLEKSVDLNPYQPQYKILLARDYLTKILAVANVTAGEQDEATLSDNVQKAIAYSKEATDISPNRVAVWETLGMIYRDIQGIATGALDWSIKSFEKAITLEPTNPVLHTELGKLYFSAGDTEKARQELEKAKQLKPDYIESSIQMALMYEVEGNIAGAVSEMEKLVNNYPFNIDASFQLGRLYFNNGQTDNAITQFEKVVALNQGHANAHYSLGIAYQKKGQTKKAISEFERVLELNPDNSDVEEKLDSLRGGEGE